MHAKAEHVGAEFVVADIEDAAAADGLAVDAGHRLSISNGGAVEPQAGEAGEPGWLQQQPGANGFGLIKALKQLDLMAVAAEKGCRGQSGRTRASNGNLDRPHWGTVLPASTRTLPARQGNVARCALSTRAPWAGSTSLHWSACRYARGDNRCAPTSV